MRRLSLEDIDELVRLQGKILSRSASIDQLLEREKLQRKSGEPPDGNIGEVPLRDAVAKLLDDITEAARGIAAIVNREDEGS
jgi:hypothetical protein